MPRKYVRKTPVASGAEEAFAAGFVAAMRPMFRRMMMEMIAEMANHWLAKNAPESVAAPTAEESKTAAGPATGSKG